MEQIEKKQAAIKILFGLWTLFWAVMIGAVVIVILTTLPPDPAVTFFDALNSVDVTDHYTFTPSIQRLIFEPIVGISRVFLSSEEGILLLLFVYIGTRIAFSYVQKKHSVKILSEETVNRWEGLVSAFVGLIFITIFAVVIILLVGFLISSFLLIARSGFIILEVTINTFSVLFFVLLALGVIMTIAPTGKIAQKFDEWRQNYYKWRDQRKLTQIAQKNPTTTIAAREIRRLVIVLGLILFGNGVAMFSPMPLMELSASLEPDEVLFDFHVHTTRSDGTLSPAERVRWYIGQGIHGAAFSDHHGIEGALEAQAYVERHNLDFTVIIAQEYSPSIPRVHLNIYGIYENINPHNFTPEIPLESPVFSDDLFLNISDTIAYVKDQGGYVTLNHYRSQDPYTWEEFRDWGIDGIEIVNGGSIQNQEMTEFALANDLICIGGSDIHGNQDLDTFVRFRLDDPQNRSLDAIFEALSKNEHEVVMVQRQRGDEGFLAPVVPDMSRYFSTLTGGQRWSWVLWLGAIYMISLAIFVMIQRNLNKQEQD